MCAQEASGRARGARETLTQHTDHSRHGSVLLFKAQSMSIRRRLGHTVCIFAFDPMFHQASEQASSLWYLKPVIQGDHSSEFDWMPGYG